MALGTAVLSSGRLFRGSCSAVEEAAEILPPCVNKQTNTLLDYMCNFYKADPYQK